MVCRVEKPSELAVNAAIYTLLAHIGDDPTRAGLQDTPDRVRQAWQFWGSGYGVDPQTLLKTFEDGAEGADQMVVVRDIELYSHCEHHLAPFFGHAHVAYIPDQRIVGLSKIARIVEVFARRLQVQERLTNQIADALFEGLRPKGVGVVITAKHFCMCSRGVQKGEAITITSALRGDIKDEPACRSEFLTLCYK